MITTILIYVALFSTGTLFGVMLMAIMRMAADD